MDKSKQLEWLKKEIKKDDSDIVKSKERFIQQITSVEKIKITNSINTTKPKKHTLLWRLRKVLGM